MRLEQAEMSIEKPAEPQLKAWGAVHCRIRGRGGDVFPRPALHVLWMNAGGFTSIHHHNRAANAFMVVQGRVELTECLPTGVISKRILTPSLKTHVVLPPTPHQLRAIEPSIVWEFVQETRLPVNGEQDADAVDGDIIRHSKGGIEAVADGAAGAGGAAGEGMQAAGQG